MSMKIATYNVNGIRARLPILLRWLAQSQPDVVCLQELKAPQEKFPIEAIKAAGYDAVWHGQKSWNGVAILARGSVPQEIQRGLPGEPDETQSRYMEATVGRVRIGSLYLPNGNPAPGPKFDYKLRWFERFIGYADELLAQQSPVVLAGDYNVIPSEKDASKPERWLGDALFFPESRAAYQRLLNQGWIDALRTVYPTIPTGITCITAFVAMLAYESTTCYSVRLWQAAYKPLVWIARYAVGRKPVIMRQHGSR